MDFTLNDEQQLLRDGLTKFLATRYNLDASRIAAKTGGGWQPDIWRSFADLGILGAALPKDYGGGGPVEMMLITEALGYALVIEPYVDTAVVAAGLLHRAGGSLASDLLAKIVDGSAIVTLAATEPASGEDWRDVSATARREADHWVLTGSKIVSAGTPLASHVLITARTSGERDDEEGISLFLVEIGSAAKGAHPGLELHHYRTIDDRRASDLVLDELRLPATALLGAPGGARQSLSQARDEGAAAICAEAVGCMRKVLADTVDYCKQRQQFGVPIASFQVLQHRMVDMFMEVEQSSAAVHLAILNLESDAHARARTVSVAKTTVGRAARFVGQQAVQLHGGMGMTEELEIGHYFKRLTAIQYEFGSTDHHVSRYAELTAQ